MTVKGAARCAVLLLCPASSDAASLAAGQDSPAGGASLDVPYLPQTEALCGGAAAAMLLRYWGDRHASVQQFAPLVDRRAGGIADKALIEALHQRGWSAVVIEGSLGVVRSELAAGRPPILLIEDRPQRYHYVVVVGIDEQAIAVHDPTWGPQRRLSFAELQAAWRSSGFWTLRVTPQAAPGGARVASDAAAAAAALATAPRSLCDERLDAALNQIQIQGLAGADEILGSLAVECPTDAGPLRELAGVRFAQHRWSDASTLASAALALDPNDRYSSDVLGSSRFMLNDVDGALRGWNAADRPVLDSVRITGLSRTRYSLLAQSLKLPSDSVITADGFTRARRRLESMPGLAAARLSLRPGEDGYAVADVAVVERATLPRSRAQWAGAAVEAALEREVALLIPGRTGQGETWTAALGWWENRPKASMVFAAPLMGHSGGVARVALSWDAQTYGANPTSLREERLLGDMGYSSWISANLRVDLNAGLDAWSRRDAATVRTLHAGVSVDRRLFNDRLGATVSLSRWAVVGGGAGFGSASADLSFVSRDEPSALVALARVGASTASEGAPFALWNGAGEGRVRAPLLRAHPLLHDGRIDGSVFGQQLVHGTVEVQHWFRSPALPRVAVAAFSDAAVAYHRPAFAVGSPLQADIGAGLRVRVPGRLGQLRLDYAHGMRDGANAMVLAWRRSD